MRVTVLIFAFASLVTAQPRVDNVLMNMVPPGSTALVGAQMDQIRQTELYKKLLAARKLSQLDEFSAQTGFDPRRDVRELLFAATPHGPVLLARGAFHVNESVMRDAKKIRHGEYTILAQDNDQGLTILDATLAAAGQVEAIEAALDEWKSGTHTAARPLLARAQAIDPKSQIWGVSTGTAAFIADHLPANNSPLDLSRILQGLTDTSFEADFNSGLRSDIHGTSGNVRDAMNLRDVVRGMVGLGRLRVPENHPELLRFWDGVTVDQQDRAVTVRIDIPQDLIDRLILTIGGNIKLG